MSSPTTSSDPAHAAVSVLVVASFPPVTGPAPAAALAAVRRAWTAGDEVITGALRPAGADLVARVAGVGAGRHLEKARVAAGSPTQLVLGLEAGQLDAGPASGLHGVAGRVGRLVTAVVGVWGLGRALRRFSRVTVLVTGGLDVPSPLLRALWRRVDTVVVPAGGEDLARAAVVPSAKVAVADPYPVTAAVPGVSALGPREVLPRDIPVVLLGIAGRRLLGERFYELRALAIRVVRRALRLVRGR